MKPLYLFKQLPLGTIDPLIYGHFSEHIGGVFYDGIWVGEDSSVPNICGFRKDLVEAFRAIHPTVLRWPGGCFAETYDWRDGIGKRADRPVRINWWHSHDKRYEPNQVGTHEFVQFCRLVGAEPYFAANLTTTTPLDIRDWIDYCNSPQGSTAYAKLREENGSPEPFNVKFWGVGNENWGGGGNMTAEVYAHEFRKYATIMRNTDPAIELIGCGPNAADYHWTQDFMRVFESSGKCMNGYSAHYYCGTSGDCLHFDTRQYYQLLKQALRMEEIIQRHWHIIQGYGMERFAKLFVDEWGCWHPGGSGPSKGYNLFEQQSTVRDALVSALTLNIFNNNCDKVRMANAAQLVNNLHCLFLAGGSNFITTPTYHIFDMYKGHQGATALTTALENPAITVKHPDNGREDSLRQFSLSASVKDGRLLVTIANLSRHDNDTISLQPSGFQLDSWADVTTLGAGIDPHAYNTFERPDAVIPVTSHVKTDAITLAPSSVTAISVPIIG